jgi:hypothetical protein
MKIRPMGGLSFHLNGRMDVTKLKIAFSNFANAPKKGPFAPLPQSRQKKKTFTARARSEVLLKIQFTPC